MNINWYPGHMAKTKRLLQENLKLVDVVIELIDARIPRSSRNPDFDNLFRDKRRVVCLNKIDLADPEVNDLWKEFYKSNDIPCVLIDSRTGKGIGEMIVTIESMMADKFKKDAAKGLRKRPVRAMVTGIPNVGKSTFINRLTGRAATRTGDRPGVTRNKQWIKVNNKIHLLDTPGILWPKLEGENTGLNLAFTGAIKDEIMDLVGLASKLLEFLSCNYNDRLEERYQISTEGLAGHDILLEICRKRGFLLEGGRYDTLKGAQIVLDEFRESRITRVSLEKP